MNDQQTILFLQAVIVVITFINVLTYMTQKRTIQRLLDTIEVLKR